MVRPAPVAARSRRPGNLSARAPPGCCPGGGAGPRTLRRPVMTSSVILALAVFVAGVGVPLIHLVPINVLRVVIGGLLLVLGLNWLRKAILRASGHKALHDEDAIYAETVAELNEDSAAGSGRPSKG